MTRTSKPDLLPSGQWRIRWIDENGKRRSQTYKDPVEANYHIKKKKIETEEVLSGLRLPPVEEKSFNELCDYWIKNRTALKRNAKDDLSIIRHHLRPAFEKIKLKDINNTKIAKFTLERNHLAKKTISNVLTLLISMLKLAHENNYIAKLPTIKKPSVKSFSKDFSYLRTQEEITRFLSAARMEDEIVWLLYATAIYTGMRQGELAALTFDDIDFSKRLITIHKSFNGPTKSGIVRHVPILDPILLPLKEWKLRCPTRLVFPNKKLEMQRPSGRIFQEVLHRVLISAGLERRINSGSKRKWYITFHDLRHTFASHWAMSSGDMFRLKEILGHKDIQTTMRYSHLSPDAFSSDYSRLGNQGLLEEAKILTFQA